MPRFESVEAQHARPEAQCLERRDAVLRGHAETLGEWMLGDLEALTGLPPAPCDAGEKVSPRAPAISTARYGGNACPVPVAAARQGGRVRGHVGEGVIGAVRRALDLGAIGCDAVRHLVLCRVERRPPRLDPDCHPRPPRARVGTTTPSSHLRLMSGAAPRATRRRCCSGIMPGSSSCPASSPGTPSLPGNAPQRAGIILGTCRGSASRNSWSASAG